MTLRATTRFRPQLPGFIDHTHAAPADLAEQLVIAEVSQGGGIGGAVRFAWSRGRIQGTAGRARLAHHLDHADGTLTAQHAVVQLRAALGALPLPAGHLR